ncbi:MAG: hypothetical protein QW343_01230 [Candidatus Norongarragalinales archaeon]
MGKHAAELGAETISAHTWIFSKHPKIMTKVGATPANEAEQRRH